MKKLIGSFFLMALLPVVFVIGCGNNNSNPSNPGNPSGPTATANVTKTLTVTNTPGSPTATPTPTATRTATSTSTITFTPTETETVTPTFTATATSTVTSTKTATETATNTATPTATATPTVTSTVTVTPTSQTPQTAVNLNTASGYAILASSGITSTESTTICGNIAISPGSSITGAPVYNCAGNPSFVGGLVTGTNAANAQSDLTTAYKDASERTNPASILGDLGGLTLYPGLYGTAGAISITGDLTLDAQGNTSAIFIFQVGTTLTTASGGNVILANGASAANIFWQVGSSCEFGSTSSFMGTVMAHTLIAFDSGAVLTGRALSETGEVTLIGNTITNPTP